MFGLGLGRMGLVGDLGFAIRRSLFGAGEAGLWYDLLDDATIFQDSAGTTLASWGDPVGLALDKSRWDGRGVVNRFLSSQEYDSANWVKLASTVTANSTIAPDGSLTADTITSTSAASSGVRQAVTVPAGATAVSVFLKQGTDRYIEIFDGDSSQNFSVFDLQTGVSTQTGTGYTPSVVSAAAGFYRCVVTFTASAGSKSIRIVFTDNNPTPGYNPTPVNVGLTMVAGGAQLELGSTATAYQANGASVGGPGNHAIQSTSGARPIRGRMPKRGRVNLLVSTGNLNGTGWTRNGVTVLPSTIVAPDGTTTADRIYPNSTGNAETRYIYCPTVNVSSISTGTISIAPAGKTAVVFYGATGATRIGYVNLTSGAVTIVAGTYTVTTSLEANGFYKITVTSPASANSGLLFAAVDAVGAIAVTANGTDGIAAWRPQLELGSTATAYQHVIDSLGFDVTESGQPSCGYLSFNGSNQWMQTAAAVDFSATDEMSVFAGVRKVSDAAEGFLIELSSSMTSNTGTFLTAAPYSSTFEFGGISRGSTALSSSIARIDDSAYAAPTFRAISQLMEISSDTHLLRINGTQVASSTGDQGTGNYGNYVTYFGARAGTTAFFNGLMFSTIIRGKLTSDTLLTRTEQYVARQTPTVNL